MCVCVYFCNTIISYLSHPASTHHQQMAPYAPPASHGPLAFNFSDLAESEPSSISAGQLQMIGQLSQGAGMPHRYDDINGRLISFWINPEHFLIQKESLIIVNTDRA